MKRSSLAWYVAVACFGGSLCVGSVAQADSPTTVKANPVVPTAMVAQVQSTQSINSTAATNTATANSELAKAAVVLERQAVHQGKSQAMPGAVEFLNEVHKQGVEIFYVSNRYAPVNYDATVQNFKELGFPSVDKEHVLLFEKDSDKQPRFEAITKKYAVILYMGDNAGNDIIKYTCVYSSTGESVSFLNCRLGVRFPLGAPVG